MAQPSIGDISDSDIDLVPQVQFSELVDKRNDLADWNGVVQRLSTLHNRYYSLLPVGVISKFPEYNNLFLEAILWINGKKPTSNFTAIPSQGDILSISAEHFTNFRDSWLPNFESRFNEQQFQIFEQVADALKNQLPKLGGVQLDEDAQKQQRINEEKSNSLKDEFKAFIHQEKKNALADISEAKALEDWVKYYEEVEFEYEQMINGTHRLKWRSFFGDGGHPYNIRTPFVFEQRTEKGANGVKIAGKPGYKIGESRKRALWFAALAISILLPVVLSFINHPTVSLFGVEIRNIFYVESSSEPDYALMFIDKIRYLPVVLVLSLGYAFSNKNYRILCNIREQYRHRKTVSKTLQGIITALGAGNEDRAVRVKLTEIGAKAMFDLKNIGHLSKNDRESGPVTEVIQNIRPSSG